MLQACFLLLEIRKFLNELKMREIERALENSLDEILSNIINKLEKEYRNEEICLFDFLYGCSVNGIFVGDAK